MFIYVWYNPIIDQLHVNPYDSIETAVRYDPYYESIFVGYL